MSLRTRMLFGVVGLICGALIDMHKASVKSIL